MFEGQIPSRPGEQPEALLRFTRPVGIRALATVLLESEVCDKGHHSGLTNPTVIE